MPATGPYLTETLTATPSELPALAFAAVDSSALLATAAMIAAVAFLFLALFACIQLVKFGQALDEIRRTAEDVNDQLHDLRPKINAVIDNVDGVLTSIDTTVVDVRDQVQKVDDITNNATTTSKNISTLSNLVTLSVAIPVVKAASLGHGVRHAMNNRRLDRRNPR